MTREEAIAMLKSKMDGSVDTSYEWAETVRMAIEALQDGWIPASKKLPEKNGVYIVSYEDAVTWLEWFNGKWFFYPSNPAREETGTIIAWMPLPELYMDLKGESE